MADRARGISRPAGWRTGFSARREVRLVLLAAMETCWVYAIVLFLTGLMAVQPFISPWSLFLAYYLALIVGRELPRREERWGILQAIAIFAATLAVLVIVRIESYPSRDWLDFGWVARLLRGLFLFEPPGNALYTMFAVIYVFARGLGFGSRPLTLWFVGFQFRLGVVSFFLVLVASVIFYRIDISFWIFTYFALSLLALSIARLDEVGSDLRLNLRWVLTIFAGVASVLVLGFALLQFFSLDLISGLLRLFLPLVFVLQIVLLIILIPASYLAGFLVEYLRPLIAGLEQLFQQLAQLFPSDALEQLDEFAQSEVVIQFILPLLKIALGLAVLALVGYLLARALNRRMERVEEETFERETLESVDGAERARRLSMRKTKPARPRVANWAAESIRRIYAALTARAGLAGVERRAAETPYEYLPRLQARWPEQLTDMSLITEAYVAVHYAEQQTTAHELNRVKEAWKRVEGTLKDSKPRRE